MQFDYPDAQDFDTFQKDALTFTTATDWAIQISPSINHNAASCFLSMLFGNRLLKSSYYSKKKSYAVTLTEYQNLQKSNNVPSTNRSFLSDITLSDTEAINKFQTTTGLSLILNGQLQAEQISK